VRPARQFWTTGSFHSEASADATERSGLIERPRSGEQRAPERMRVLVVEPAAVLRNIMLHALSVQGYDVRAAAGVAGLAQRLAAFDPHLLVSETALLDGTGAQVCNLARSHGRKRVPVILMSGLPEPELEVRARAAGADGHFCKARGLSRLLDLVEELTSEIVY
jgi:DNA-binding response OmpR family regulator